MIIGIAEKKHQESKAVYKMELAVHRRYIHTLYLSTDRNNIALTYNTIHFSIPKRDHAGLDTIIAFLANEIDQATKHDVRKDINYNSYDYTNSEHWNKISVDISSKTLTSAIWNVFTSHTVKPVLKHYIIPFTYLQPNT